MDREHRLARLFRALTDKTQQDLAKQLGIEKGTLTNCESGKLKPSSALLDRMAEAAGITVDQGDELLQLHDTLSRTPQRVGRDPEALFADLGEPLRTRAHRAFQRLLILRLPDTPPRAEDRIPAKELFANLEKLTPDQRIAVVRIATEYQTWAVCELAVERSLAGGGEAETWAELAVEISEYVGGGKERQNRVRGYAMAAKAKALLGAGKIKEAAGVSQEAWKLWAAGVDGEGLLEGGRVGLET
ncbi:MAG: helix-turn-helix protein [Acidobacteriota bacterium]|jgi:transcriptional regulator with XRE-family HTH domain|nr:helix-turn-helix protein [Acidobacteriota bacterium]